MDETRDSIESQFTFQPGVPPGEARSQILTKMGLPLDFPHLAYRLHNQPVKMRIELVTDQDMAKALEALAKATQNAVKHQARLIISNTVSRRLIVSMPMLTLPLACGP